MTVPNRDCGHPNHGADDHDCGAFVGDRTHPFNPPPGQCHALRCEDDSTWLVQVYRKSVGRWTSGIDYCEKHAHEFADRTSMRSRLVQL